LLSHLSGTAVVFVIVWQLNLQLPMQSVPITTKSCEFEARSGRDSLNTTICNKVYQWLATGRWLSPGTLVSSTNKTDHHDISEILLKVALITITRTLSHVHLLHIILSCRVDINSCTYLKIWLCDLIRGTCIDISPIVITVIWITSL
jgi:hypothetical protein